MEKNFERPWSGRVCHCFTSCRKWIYLVDEWCHRNALMGQRTEGWGKGATAGTDHRHLIDDQGGECKRVLCGNGTFEDQGAAWPHCGNGQLQSSCRPRGLYYDISR